MEISIFSKDVVGYKNQIKDKSSQDYLSYEIFDEGIICAIADGHSGEFFTYSHKGARFACESAIEIMKKYMKEDRDNISNLLQKNEIQKNICNKWRYLVDEDFKENLPRVYKLNYFKYGTTLLTVIITHKYKLFLKLGDGDILIKKNNEYKKILFTNKKNIIVDCVAEENAYNKMQYKLEEIDDLDKTYSIIMYSDGFENSFFSKEMMIKDLNETIKSYKKNIFTRMFLEESYKKYLWELSKKGSYDDISIIIVNIM